MEQLVPELTDQPLYLLAICFNAQFKTQLNFWNDLSEFKLPGIFSPSPIIGVLNHIHISPAGSCLIDCEHCMEKCLKGD
jgi:hypothetical protein